MLIIYTRYIYRSRGALFLMPTRAANAIIHLGNLWSCPNPSVPENSTLCLKKNPICCSVPNNVLKLCECIFWGYISPSTLAPNLKWQTASRMPELQRNTDGTSLNSPSRKSFALKKNECMNTSQYRCERITFWICFIVTRLYEDSRKI